MTAAAAATAMVLAAVAVARGEEDRPHRLFRQWLCSSQEAPILTQNTHRALSVSDQASKQASRQAGRQQLVPAQFAFSHLMKVLVSL